MATTALTLQEMANVPAEQWTKEMYDQAYMSYIESGDLTRIPLPARVNLYNSICEGLGLDPKMRPLTIIDVKGKKILYVPKTATDAYAAKYNITRKILAPPTIEQLGKDNVIAVHVAGIDPVSGRTEEDYYYRAIVQGDPLPSQMLKAVSAAKRRATLPFMKTTGAGFISEDDLDTLPGATVEDITNYIDADPPKGLQAPNHQKPVTKSKNVTTANTNIVTNDEKKSRWQAIFKKYGATSDDIKSLWPKATMDQLENLEQNGSDAKYLLLYLATKHHDIPYSKINSKQINDLLWYSIKKCFPDSSDEDLESMPSSVIVDAVIADRDSFVNAVGDAWINMPVPKQ